MKGMLIVFVAGATACAASLMGSSFVVEAFTPFIATVTALGMLTAWLIAADHTPKTNHGAGLSSVHTHNRAA